MERSHNRQNSQSASLIELFFLRCVLRFYLIYCQSVAKQEEKDKSNIGSNCDIIILRTNLPLKPTLVPVNVQGRFSPFLQATKALRVSRGIALLFLEPRNQMGVGSQPHAPVACTPQERPGTHCTGGWVGPRAGLDRSGESRPPPGIFFLILSAFVPISVYSKYIVLL